MKDRKKGPFVIKHRVYVRINIISELFKPLEKKSEFKFKLYSSIDPFILFYYINKTINIVNHETIRFVTGTFL